MISVTIPVGPDPAYRDYLEECVASVMAQDHLPAEIMLVDDQAHLSSLEVMQLRDLGPVPIRVWCTPWLSGVAHSFNFGVALAKTDLVVMLGSDDVLETWAVEDCRAAWEIAKDPLGYYHMDVKYSTGEEQSAPCHAAMVHKDLWRRTGGFPVQSAIGAPDHIFINMLLIHGPKAGRLHRVASAKPPYWYRVHDGTWTRRHASSAGVIAPIREWFAQHWEVPTWPR
jgi:glycosyltransferase involved in cell wall biosynthesis